MTIFSVATPLPLADSGTTNHQFVQTGDFNGDGAVDFLVQEGGITGTAPNQAGTAVTLWLNNGSGSYTSSGVVIPDGVPGLSLGSSNLRIADIDDDGDLDYYQTVTAQAANGNDNDLYFVNDGTGHFTQATPPIADNNADTINVSYQGLVRFFDVDNDGDADVLTQQGGPGTAVTLQLNDGSGGYGAGTEVIAAGVTGLALNNNSVRIADFDGDGDLDYYQPVTSSTGTNNDLYYANDGSGHFTAAAVPIPDGNTTTQSALLVFDADNDGYVDILTQFGGAGSAVTLWTNNGSGGFTSSVVIGAGAAGLLLNNTATRIGDFDNDGDIDYYQRVSGAGNDIFYENAGKPPTLTSFTPSANGTAGATDNLVLTFSHDSALSKGAGTITIRIDNGDGNFANDTVFETFAATDARVTLSGNATASTVTINPTGNLAPGTNYYVVIEPTAFMDADGKGFVTQVGNRFHAGTPDPARQQAGNSLDALADRTVMSFGVSANVAPLATTSGGATAFIEGSNVASTPVAVDGGITVTDADSLTLASATVRITGNFQAGEDVLAFTNTGSMGNITGSYNAGTGELTLSSAGALATVVQWQAALRAVTYTNSSDSPDPSSRTISFQVNDGTASSAAGTKMVTVASANDVPVNLASGGATAFIAGNNAPSTPVAVDGGFTVTDADSATLASATVRITNNFQVGEDVLAFANTGGMGNNTGSNVPRDNQTATGTHCPPGTPNCGPDNGSK